MRKLVFAFMVILVVLMPLVIQMAVANPSTVFPHVSLTSPYFYTKQMSEYVGDSFVPKFLLFVTNSSSEISTIKVCYSLDGKGNISIPNTHLYKFMFYDVGYTAWIYNNKDYVITGLTNGKHNMTVYAQTLIGNVSDSATFLVKGSQVTEEPTPIQDPILLPLGSLLAISFMIATVAIALILLVYSKRRKGKP
jgi:hypothetical protein